MIFTKSRQFATISIFGGAIFAIVSLLLFLFKTTKLEAGLPIEPAIFASYGGLVGGVVGTLFSLAGVFLLIQNLNDQEKNFTNQQLQNRFFELIQFHRDNSDGVTIKGRKGKKVFISLLREHRECLELAKSIFTKDEITKDEIVNISYLMFFYGAVGLVSKEILEERLSGTKYESKLDQIISKSTEKQKSLMEDEVFDYKPFEGHQSRLGHYFRHLFQGVAYINDQNESTLNYDEKYQYVKVLRAQLSNQEQALLFFNSLSDLGKPWEPGGDDIDRQLITKYNLIKNIPAGYTQDIDIRQYYPDVHFEGDEQKTEKRKELEKKYC